MREKRYIVAGMMMAVLLTGCGAKEYTPVDTEAFVSGESETDGQGDAAAEAIAINTSGIEQPSIRANVTEITRETAPVMEERDETVYVTASRVNLRTAPDPASEVVTRLDTGTELMRKGYSESWSKVVYQGKEYYISSSYISAEKPEAKSTIAETGTAASAGAVALDPSWKYAEFSKINSGTATMYRSEASNRKGIVVCVNAGHGTGGGSSVKTLCHPDGTAKVTGGSTGAGATTATAVSSGTTFLDGTSEAKVTLAMAKVLKEKLLARGYDVLMIRESDDVQLDNIARTVIANNTADCHIALHWDSTTSDKGAFYMSVPNVASYRSMEPVASNWQKHNALGESLIAGLKGSGVKIFSGGSMEMDLTQTSYSTIASIDIELGDRSSDHGASALDTLGNGIADGIELYFAK